MSDKRVYKKSSTLTGGGLYRKWAEWDEGDMIVFKYEARGIDQYDKTNWKGTVLECSFADGTSDKYLDKNLNLNSSGQLDKAMEQLSFGQVVQIVYQGTSEITKGKYVGKKAHNVEVSLLEEDTGETVSSDDDILF